MRYLLATFLLFIVVQAQAGTSQIYAQRVSATGAVIGSPVVVYAGATEAQSRPQVSFYDDRFLVVWHEWNGSDLDVKAARIAMDGTVLDTTPLSLGVGSRTQALPDVAADSTGWLAVWHSFDGTDAFPSLFARRVNYDGTLETAQQFGDNYIRGSAPRIAWDSVAAKFAVLFTSSGNNAEGTLRWSLLTSANPIVATYSTNYLFVPNTGEHYYSPAAMPGGGWSFISNGQTPMSYTFRSNPSQIAVHIETTGLINPRGPITNGESATWSKSDSGTGDEFLDNNDWTYGGSDVATDSNYAIGVWTRYHLGGDSVRTLYNGDLYAARIDKYDPVEAVGGTAVAASSSSERLPSLAGDGAGSLLIVYDKETNGRTEIASKILSVDGSGISAQAEVILRTADTGGRRSHSAVAYGDDGAGTKEYLVVWSEGWWGAL